MVATGSFARTLAMVGSIVALLASGLTSAGSVAAAPAVSLLAGPVRSNVSSSEKITITAALANREKTALAAGVLTVASSESVLTSDAELDEWFAAKSEDTGAFAETPVPAIKAGFSAAMTLDFPASALPEPSAWGVRGLLVTYEVDGQTVASTRSSIVVLGTNAPAPVQVATLLPLIGSASALGLMTADELAQATGQYGYLTTMLNASATAPVTLAVDPRVTTSILALGASAPPSAVAWLDTLKKSSRGGFWLTYGDSDVSGQIQAGAKTFVTPGISDVPNMPAPAAGKEWDGLDWPGWKSTMPGVIWPLSGTVSSAVITATTARGFSRILISSQNIAPPVPANASGVIAGAPAAIVNTAASACLQSLETANTGAQQAASAACLNSRLAVTAASNPQGSSAVVSLARTKPAQLSAGSFSRALEILAAVPFSRAASLSSILAGASAPLTLTELRESPGRLAQLSGALSNQAKIVAFSPVAVEDTAVVNPGQRRLAAISSSAWLGSSQWTIGLTQNTALTSEVLNAVSIATSSTINMVSGQARIPVVVKNGLPSAVSVVIHSVPSNARIAVAGSVPLTIEANAQGRAYIPVTARVGSGAVILEVSITNEFGEPVGKVALLPVNVRADWETYGILGLAIVFFGLVAAGVVRTMRRRKARND